MELPLWSANEDGQIQSLVQEWIGLEYEVVLKYCERGNLPNEGDIEYWLLI